MYEKMFTDKTKMRLRVMSLLILWTHFYLPTVGGQQEM